MSVYYLVDENGFIRGKTTDSVFIKYMLDCLSSSGYNCHVLFFHTDVKDRWRKI